MNGSKMNEMKIIEIYASLDFELAENSCSLLQTLIVIVCSFCVAFTGVCKQLFKVLHRYFFPPQIEFGLEKQKIKMSEPPDSIACPLVASASNKV